MTSYEGLIAEAILAGPGPKQDAAMLKYELRYACGQAIQCRCGGILDCRRAVFVGAEGRPGRTLMCHGCARIVERAPRPDGTAWTFNPPLPRVARTVIRHIWTDDGWTAVEASPGIIRAEGLKLFARQGENGWIVTEESTGLVAARADTKATAIKRARENFAAHPAVTASIPVTAATRPPRPSGPA